MLFDALLEHVDGVLDDMVDHHTTESRSRAARASCSARFDSLLYPFRGVAAVHQSLTLDLTRRCFEVDAQGIG